MSDLNNIKFLDHCKRQGKTRLHADVVMTSCSVSHTPTHTHNKILSGLVSVVSGSELMAHDRVMDQPGWHRLLSCKRSPL